MILSNRAIVEALDAGRLRIDPEPSPRPVIGGEPSPFDTCAVDLRLGSVLQIPRQGLSIAIDLRGGDVRQTLGAISESHSMDATHGFRLDGNRFVLGQTLERVSLPLPAELSGEAEGKRCLAARVEGKSSRARFGLLVHFTAPTIHAGWSGPITLEIMNLGPTPILLYPGMAICQLILEEVDGVPFENPSIFHGQTLPSGQ